jgi:hypothetical protein
MLSPGVFRCTIRRRTSPEIEIKLYRVALRAVWLYILYSLGFGWLMRDLGLISDPTHRQYGYESAIDTFEAYLEHKTEDTKDYYDPVTQKVLGQCYWEHRDELDDIVPEGEAKAQFHRFFLQATIMTINNTVHKSLRQFGGPEALLRKTDADFEAAQHQIMTSLHTQLMDLRAEMDHMLFSQGDFSYEDLEGMVRDCHGVGHTECEAALSEIWRKHDDQI